MDADGNNLRRLTNHLAWNGFPSWSPDGQRIAFQSNQDGGKKAGVKNSEIYVMNADGNNLRRLTNHLAWNGFPSWSHDSPLSERDWNSEIYVMDADGNNLRNLTNHPAPDYQPNWFNPAGYPVSPAGKLRATIWGWLKQ